MGEAWTRALTKAEKRVLCPRCGSRPNAGCVQLVGPAKTGGLRRVPHAERMEELRRATRTTGSK